MINSICVKVTNVDGVLEITSDVWDGKILRMSYKAYRQWRNKGEKLDTAAAYVLFADHFDKQKFGKELYVGHTGCIDDRLDQHVAGKDYWSVVLVFVSGSDWMNVAYTQNIEYKFIEWAKLANRYDVMNGNDSAPTHLGEDDKERIEKYLSSVREILKISGIDIFERNFDGVYERVDRACQTKIWSGMQITDLTTKMVKIMSGSEIILYNHQAIMSKNLNGVTYDSQKCALHFSIDMEVQVDMSVIPRIFGNTSLSKWKSACGITLSDALKKT